ncbi:unnamed protein product [Ilex paraguariensis]|uniref:Aluminum-activated malate transporter 8 n=2 Tax=Ilex paraguariensis TaxID=185542 RepID=A0ABC8UJ76_9AQUA
MEIGSATQENTRPISRGCGWLKALPGKFKAKGFEIVTKTKKLGEDDPRRIRHSLKAGLAITLVSLFYYLRPLYDAFGQSGMWAILTVVLVIDFSVGATLCRSLNRGFATLIAGALAIGTEHFATLFGEKGEPIVLGFLVFFIAAASTFTRFFPVVRRRYDYGAMIFILTFSLISVSGYRVEKIFELGHKRLSTIIIGAATCMVISIFVCPVWAGEDLHNLVADNIEKLASFLEGFGDEYFKFSEDGDSAMVSKDDNSVLQDYKNVLNSKENEESLANFAWWEPCHGRFGFCHPWKQYLKIGVLSRQCAYQIETLNGYINPQPQAPSEFRRKIQQPCTKLSSESSKALKELASAIKNMTHPSSCDLHLQNSKAAAEELKIALEASPPVKTDLLEVIPAVTVASILINIIKSVENISASIHELSDQARFRTVKSNVIAEKPQLFHSGTVKPISDGDGDGGDGDGGGGDHIVIIVSPENGNPQGLMRSQHVEV